LFLCVEDLAHKRYAQATDRWLVRPATPSEAETLQLPPTSSVVHLVHVAQADDDTVLEVSESIWPADRIEFIDEYPVAQEAEDADGMSDI
jgi:GntR family transcriptional regulator